MADVFLGISELGQRYLDGSLRQQQLGDDFTPSRREDVPHCSQFPAAAARHYREQARESLARGEVAFAVLAAGASSRMHLNDIPAGVAAMVRKGGNSELPGSKALVPVIESQAQVLNYLDLFLINVRRFGEQSGTRSTSILFLSEANAAEIRAHLQKVRYQGLDAERVLTFVQPLAPQIVAMVEDLQKAEKNFAAPDLHSIKELSQQHAGHDLPQRKPGGHGEFLHQLIASGLIGQLLQHGVRYISVRNIDNTASVIDQNWLTAFGYFLGEQADMLVEVAQRPHGQKGGALIRQANRWRLAEDPAFAGTRYHAADSYYINAAAATLRLEYFYPIYETSAAELLSINQLPESIRHTRLAEIAQRGRAKFPTLIDAKPVKLTDGRTVAAVTPETNMWESTGVDQRLKILPIAVDSDRDAGSDLVRQSESVRRQRALRVRFSPTKSWADYEDANKQCIASYIAERIVAGDLLDDGGG